MQKLKLIPTLIRSDGGKENTVIQYVREAFRAINDNGNFENDFIIGTSIANQRVENTWGRIRKHAMYFWINFFKYMERVFFQENMKSIETRLCQYQ